MRPQTCDSPHNGPEINPLQAAAASTPPVSFTSRSGKTTVARLYYRLLKDLRVFAAAESRAQDAKITAEAEAKKNADAAEKARQDAERRAFQSVGLPYTQSAARAGAGTSTPTATSASARLAESTAATAGFVETTGADLADKGVRGLKDMLKKIREAGGGVLFVDEVRVAAAVNNIR